MYFRHDNLRPSQKDLMSDIYDALIKKQNFMAQAPVGLGKTDAALAAAITFALENKKTVFFLTPKISQHKIAMDVVNGIAKKYSLNLRAVDLVGRSHCCIDPFVSKVDPESFQSSCAKKRKNKECEFYLNARGSSTVQEAQANFRFKVFLESYGTGQTHDEVIKEGIKKRCCPYEWLLKSAEGCNVIIGDYYHILVPQIRDIFLMKIKKRIEDSIIIVDEAHNLASRIRSSLSSNISTFTLKRVAKEMRAMEKDAGPILDEFILWAHKEMKENDPIMIGQTDSKNQKPAFKKLTEKETTLDSFAAFINRFGLDIQTIISNLEEVGSDFVEKSGGKKSACLKFASFLANYFNDDLECVRILKEKNGEYFLSKKMLDPSKALTVLNLSYNSVLMSGTLMPLDMHRDVLGLDKERTKMRVYKSPFDPKNVVNIVTPNITSKYSRRDKEGYELIASSIQKIIDKTPGGTALFFPSYSFMEQITNRLKRLKLGKELFIQATGMKNHELKTMIRDFKNSEGVLCAVQGGSLSEGVDFSNGEIKTAVIVGVALEEMGVEIKALIDYYDQKFGRGWDYGYIYPGVLKAIQAAGRGRRKESDKLAVVFMDERYQWEKYNWLINKSEKKIISENPEDEVERFWVENKGA